MKRLYTKILAIALYASPALMLAGCEKFLDADQPLQVDEDQVFSNYQGFEETLNGVYLQMGTRTLYGREMSFGFLSILGRSYDTTINARAGNLYYEGARYNFADPAVAQTIRNIWDSAYLCIANINYLLEQTEKRKSILTASQYNMIRGEGLALRAYLHFDLLRMYGPAKANENPATPAIPYVVSLSPQTVATAATTVVMDSCLSDLKKAGGLLAGFEKANGHLRSWGVKALQARIYLFKGDLDNARLHAQQVIDGGAFPFVTNNSDLLFTREHVFNLMVYANTLGTMQRSFFNTSAPMGLMPVNQNALYISGSGNTTDWRRSGAFIDPATGQTTNPSNPNAVVMPRKFSSSTNNVVPMIRISEMHYIVAECAAAANDAATATARLNAVRAGRNLPPYGLTLLPVDSLQKEIVREYQKEMLGEAQMFFQFKRNNLPFSNLPFTKVPVVANASYVFPRPE